MYKFIAMAWLLSTNLQAAPVVSTETQYYLVDGKNAQAIRKDMNAKRSRHYDAYTAWQVNWNFYWNDNRSSCTLTKVNTKVAVKFTLPKLATDSLADQNAKQRWNSYYSALIAHENGHRDFGVNAATAIEQALLSMGSRDNCKVLEKEANNLAYRVLDKYIADEKLYDIDTNHGMNDGATFP
jgi:predicted secreted Zn-dependent protease